MHGGLIIIQGANKWVIFWVKQTKISMFQINKQTGLIFGGGLYSGEGGVILETA